MSDTRIPVPATALDHESTIVAVVELSACSWLVDAQVAGVARQCRQKLIPSAEELLDHLDHLPTRPHPCRPRQPRRTSGVRRAGCSREPGEHGPQAVAPVYQKQPKRESLATRADWNSEVLSKIDPHQP
jgi:hypothetical protein